MNFAYWKGHRATAGITMRPNMVYTMPTSVVVCCYTDPTFALDPVFCWLTYHSWIFVWSEIYFSSGFPSPMSKVQYSIALNY